MSTSRSNRHNVVTDLQKRYFEQTGKTFKYPKTNVELEHLRKLVSGDHQQDQPEKRSRYKLVLTRSALDNHDRVYTWEPGPNDKVSSAMLKLLKIIVKDNPSIKLIVTAVVHFVSAVDSSKDIVTDLIQPPRIILADDNLINVAAEITSKYIHDVEEYTGVGSGWVFDRLVMIKFDVFKYNPLRVGKFVELPASIKASQCCINVKSDDDRCLIWSILAALHPADKNPNRIGNYINYLGEINTAGIKFPVKIEQIDKFVENNRVVLPGGINIFGLDNQDKLFPRKLSKTPNDTTINLLLYQEHFSWIKNFNGLARKQFSKHKSSHVFCVKCLAGFTKQDDLAVHARYCIHEQRESFPRPGQNKLKFKNHRHSLYNPVTIIYDFESMLVPEKITHEAPSRTTTLLNKHVPVAVAYKIQSSDSSLNGDIKLYRRKSNSDEDPAVWLLRNLLTDADQILTNKVSPVLLTHDELIEYAVSTHCYVCKTELSDDAIKSHRNITGKYHGAAHSECAKKHQQVVIPVIAHNSRGYDHHFVITALADPSIQKLIGNHAIDGIPTNTEKFMSLTIRRQLKFIDSNQFMAASLEQLAKNCSVFPTLDKHFGDKSMIMRQKGIFPYEYITDYARLEETRLPPHENFYSVLNGENVSTNDYNRAIKTFNVLGCTTIGDYLDVYLVQDVALLCDVVEEFRNSSMFAYKLDPCWYVSSPGLAWDAMLKISNIELELITDPDKYHFIEQAMRGGISVITKRKSTANNKDVPGFNESAPVMFLTYLDANNLYGWAMSESMPYRCGSFVEEPLFNALTQNCTKDLSDADYSFFVEADVECPEHLHDLHSDYPFLAEKMSVPDCLLSPTLLRQRGTLNGPAHEKLVPNLLPKRNYICHYRALHQAVSAGLVVKKVHRALKFFQSEWLAPYIKYNTDMRAKATNDFQKDFFKLMNNSVFGKTMGNVRNRCNIELINDNTKRFSKLVSQNDFNGRITIKGNLVFVIKHKTDILLAKPIFVGVTVLDISKTLMYDFHYNFIKKEYPGAQLCFSDTDSLLYEIPGEDCQNDLYASIYKHRSLFDLSNVVGKYSDGTNKKVIGKFKDELNFDPIKEFIGLRPKMYYVLAVDAKQNKIKSKGVKKSVVKKTFTHEMYQLVHSGEQPVKSACL